MHKNSAIILRNVSKVYRLHGSQSDQLIEVLGLKRLGFRTKSPHTEFSALSNISLEVPRGHRVGIIGRNGAGKTTLLKLICGNFAPTSGEVLVQGTVQALMSMGLGFHPEYTGRQNAESSLQYNGLSKLEYQKALEGVIEFCELDEFFDQPFKTYSLGMQARLMFAVATAIHPDILIVDEVLGAGDAYFVAKSKRRVEAMINNGCTMLLVSHSMQQVLELCDEAVWIDNGSIRMLGKSFLVVKAYEEYLHGFMGRITNLSEGDELGYGKPKDSLEVPALPAESDIQEIVTTNPSDHTELRFQEPNFIPHNTKPTLPSPTINGLNFIAPGGVSRWESKVGLKVVGFGIVNAGGLSDTILSLQPAKFVIRIQAELGGQYDCRYGIAINDHLGRCMTRIFSPADSFLIQENEYRSVEILLNPCQIGPGEYTVGISVHPYTEIEYLNQAGRYDLLSRSFQVKVELPESLAAIEGSFFHSAEWLFS
jgi:lipopolysaccharide transport system ATP-binding protein